MKCTIKAQKERMDRDFDYKILNNDEDFQESNPANVYVIKISHPEMFYMHFFCLNRISVIAAKRK